MVAGAISVNRAKRPSIRTEKQKTDIAVGSSEPEYPTQILSCGEDRIRTCGRLRDNRLAGGPNRPLWHLPHYR